MEENLVDNLNRLFQEIREQKIAWPEPSTSGSGVYGVYDNGRGREES